VDTVLVTGATGRQGGAVVDALLADDGTVRALTRDPSSERARALSARGVEVVRGDMERRSDLRRAMAGVDGVFLMTDYFAGGRAAEISQGRNGVRAAVEAGVGHLVYSSVGSADQPSGLAHFRSKGAVEAYLRKMLPGATVVRPTYFATKFEGQRDAIASGRLALPLGPRTRLAVVDPRDIGRVVARVFAAPERFAGQTLTLAGDQLTPPEFAAAFSHALGRPVTYERVPSATAREAIGEELAAMFEWFDAVGYDADVGALERETGVEMTQFADYLGREWAATDAASAAGGERTTA
jgi:uncharacterized protein YbjT (DUF2867 family)